MATSLQSTLRASSSRNYWIAEVGKWVRTNFQVDFCAHMYFQTTIQSHCSQNLVDFLPWPYQCLFAPSAQKGMGREKISPRSYICANNVGKLPSEWTHPVDIFRMILTLNSSDGNAPIEDNLLTRWTHLMDNLYLNTLTWITESLQFFLPLAT